MHRLADNWGQPALMDDDTGKRLAGVFNGHIAPEVCKTVCALLHGWQESGRYLTPRILLYGVHFLQVRHLCTGTSIHLRSCVLMMRGRAAAVDPPHRP